VASLRRFFARTKARRALASVLALGLVGVALPPMIRTVSAQQQGVNPNAEGIEGAVGDRPSQANAPVVTVSPDDAKVREIVAKNAGAPGPQITAGPGEVAAVALKPLAAGSKSAIDLVGSPELVGDPPVKTVPVVGVADKVHVVVLPPDPDEKEFKRVKPKPKFDAGSSKRSARTATGDGYDNADGSKTVKVGVGGVAVDSKGVVSDADDRLIADVRVAGKVRQRVGKIDAQLATEVTDGELVGVGEAGARIGLRPKFASAAKGTKGSVSGSKAKFPAVFTDGADLEYNVSGDGVKEHIVLASKPAGTGPVEYRFDLVLDGLTARANKDNTVSFLDKAGKEAYVIPLGAAWEQGALPSDALFSPVAVTLETTGGSPVLVVRPDTAWLRDPARKYPVVIDPTITPGRDTANAWASYQIGSSTYYPPDPSGVAYMSGAPGSVPLMRFDVSPATNKTVNSGLLRVRGVQSYIATRPITPQYPATLTVQPLGSPFDPATVTGSSAPVVRPESASVTVTAAGDFTIDISPWVVKWASGEWPNYGIRFGGATVLQASGVGSTYLEVTYTEPGVGTNRAPSVPVAQAPLALATVSNPVTLSVTSKDLDGDDLRYSFQGSCVAACTPANATATFNSGWQATGSWTITGVTPAAGEGWDWTAFVTDNVAPAVNNTPQRFTVAAAPTVTGATESWAWGETNVYQHMSIDVQTNAGVNTGTKRFVYSSTDEQVASIGPQLALSRTYNSGDTTVGAFGLGWSSILDARVDLDGSGNMLFRFPDGRREVHPIRADGTYATAPGYWSTASVEVGTSDRLLLEKDGSLWRFRASDGKLRSVVDRNGRVLQLMYFQALTTPFALRAMGVAG
jgi:hypothetical protein